MSETDALDVVLRDARRVMVTDAVPPASHLIGAEVVIDLSAPAELDRLRTAMAVASVPGMVCACLGDVRFDFLDEDGGDLTAVVLHHGLTLRWYGWDGDAVLVDGISLLRWLDDHGASGPLRQFEEDERRRLRARSQEAEWLAAMPAVLADLSERILAPSQMGGNPSPDLLAEIQDRLDHAFPEPASRVLALLKWCGAGTGRFSGFPVYELVPSLLLKDLPIADIVAGLQDPRADARHDRGAVRHLAGWKSRRRQKRDIAAIPAPLKARLLETARASGDREQQRRASQWLNPDRSN
ncbi:hypothetical protein [Actinoallomurus sp. CA-150999]|uniref:hypothetical protein n=1 Tax=Actinoallomurus sp. CA-150999 TaxID=3239887 RepID=UPI003D91A7EE